LSYCFLHLKSPPWFPSVSNNSNGTALFRFFHAFTKRCALDLGLVTLGVLEGGSRVRASFSYDSCPGASTDINDLDTTVNFDIGLCGVNVSSGNSECLFFSESLDDSNEGFDVMVPEGAGYEQATLYLYGPSVDGWPDCPDGKGASQSFEPYGWAVAWWGPMRWWPTL